MGFVASSAWCAGGIPARINRDRRGKIVCGARTIATIQEMGGRIPAEPDRIKRRRAVAEGDAILLAGLSQHVELEGEIA